MNLINNNMKDLYLQSILKQIKSVAMSKSSLETLMEFERVISDLNLYAYKYWKYGELVEGPIISKYRVECKFCWPYKRMPDPRGVERLLQYGIKVKFQKSWLKYPIQIKHEEDYRGGVNKAKIAKSKIWIVTLNIPKHLIKDVTKGSEEIQDNEIDMSDVDNAYEQGFDEDVIQDAGDGLDV